MQKIIKFNDYYDGAKLVPAVDQANEWLERNAKRYVAVSIATVMESGMERLTVLYDGITVGRAIFGR